MHADQYSFNDAVGSYEVFFATEKANMNYIWFRNKNRYKKRFKYICLHRCECGSCMVMATEAECICIVPLTTLGTLPV